MAGALRIRVDSDIRGDGKKSEDRNPKSEGRPKAENRTSRVSMEKE
jgi:hypothetical protein